MKIVLTGAGGGHFYPLIAVAEQIKKIAFQNKVSSIEMYFVSDKNYDEKALGDNNIEFIQIESGKLRLYPSLQTIGDMFSLVIGCIKAVFVLFRLYPDVVFAKGGYASVPTLFASRVLGIPVVVHESDSVPGRTTLYAAKFATSVAVSYGEVASAYNFNPRVVHTGQPIRQYLLPPQDYVRKRLDQGERPLILILGGSSGSKRINEFMITILPTLLDTADIIHQCGSENVEEIKLIANSILQNHTHRSAYECVGFVDLANVYPRASLAISRAGSAMFECALWQIPVIAIPIPESISRDQRTNSYTFASHGLCSVVEEGNLSVSVMLGLVKSLLYDEKQISQYKISSGEMAFMREASSAIAEEVLRAGTDHH